MPLDFRKYHMNYNCGRLYHMNYDCGFCRLMVNNRLSPIFQREQCGYSPVSHWVAVRDADKRLILPLIVLADDFDSFRMQHGESVALIWSAFYKSFLKCKILSSVIIVKKLTIGSVDHKPALTYGAY